MNSTEIRISILFQYYRAAFNGKGYGEREENPQLTETPKNVINANLNYLIDKGLINGNKHYFNEEIVPITTDITAYGMDVVEKIMENALPELEVEVKTEIESQTQTDQKVNSLYEKCVKIAHMCEVVVNVAGPIFAAL